MENFDYTISIGQLGEQLTLNQRAQGSSPWKRTKQKSHPDRVAFLFGAASPTGNWSFPVGRLRRSRCALRFSSQGLSA